MMALSGLLSWLLYTSFGMAYLPLALWNRFAPPLRISLVGDGLANSRSQPYVHVGCTPRLTLPLNYEGSGSPLVASVPD